MQSLPSTMPFGQRPASFGLIARDIALREGLAAAQSPGANTPAAVNKWTLLKTITAARGPLGLSDRTLGLLHALLTFHPEVALSLPPASAGEGEGATADPALDLIVFPSNRALSARAHGMAEKTIRRHLAALVEAGLIVRRDSPNGKRYARAGGEGFADAYGFDLTPLVLRAAEFETLAEAERQKGLAVKRLGERVSLLRRDIAKSLALALEAGIDGPFEDYLLMLQPLMTPLRRIGPDPAMLERLVAELTALRASVTEALETHIRNKEMTGNAGDFDRHQSNSNSKPSSEPEPVPPESRGEAETDPTAPQGAEPAYSLGMVLEACPDVTLFAEGGAISSWAAFRQTVLVIRPMLGISPDAWRAAVEALGETTALIVVASILQRSEHSSEARSGAGGGLTVNGSPAIRSAGGYLRALTEEARAGTFRLGPVLMALIGQRLKAQRA